MYISNAVIDAVTRSVPEVFNLNPEQVKVFKKITKVDSALTEDGFPVEPVYWPDQAAVPNVVGYRGAGAISLVEGNGDGLVVVLGTGTDYGSFMERSLLRGTRSVSTQPGTVLDNLQARCLWPNVADNVRAPTFEGATETNANGHMAEFVNEGKHVEGVAARLVALALEHALVPFTTRTRIRNATACYWCTGKYRSDNILYSLQNVQAINEWATPGGVGQEHDPTVVVWVGDATKVRGMALLSRIMDVGGPMYGQESHLCRQFDAGRLLMAGTGTLARDLRPVEASDLATAIDEALYLLVVYNGLQVSFVRNALRLLVRNLPVLDRGHVDEVGVVGWRVRDGEHGAPILRDDHINELDRVVVERFGAQTLAACGLDDATRRQVVFSDLFRSTIHAPPAGVGGLAPHVDVAVGWVAAALVSALQGPTIGAIMGQSVHFAHFDAAVPPAIAPIPPPQHGQLVEVYGCLSGRYAFHIYGYSTPPPADEVEPVVPGGWARVAAPPDDLLIPAGMPNDGAWMEWIGGNDLAGVPYTMGNTMRAYVLRQWVPTTEASYSPTYTRPPAVLRRFRLADNFRLAVGPGNTWPDLAAASPALQRYVVANARGGDPLDFLTAEAPVNLRGLTPGQKAAAIAVGVAYLWDANHIGGTQNHAYGAWVRATHNEERLTTVPDELKVYLGGARSRRYVEANGGLWTLCFQKEVITAGTLAGHEPTLELLRDRHQLAAYILKLRCAIEMADVMANMSNARLTGCAVPDLWPHELDARLNRGRIDHMTIVDPASYLSLQALYLAAVFDHPDAVVARTFDVTACSTLRVREPVMGRGFDVGAIKHMNWVAPQILSVNTWMTYFGVAAPTFVPDRVGQSWLRDSRYTTAWNDVAPQFLPGTMVDREDEIWCAVLSGYAYSGWAPATMILAQYGDSLRVDVTDLRTRYSQRYAPLISRLALPYETRIGHVVVRGSRDVESMMRPKINCDFTGGYRDGERVIVPTVAYNGNGRIAQVTVGDRVAASVLDLKDTVFASEGLDLGRVNPTLVMPGIVSTNASTGQFWVTTIRTKTNVSAGMSAGGQRLLVELSPPGPVDPVENGGGEVVKAPQAMVNNKPDVDKQVNPGVSGGLNIGNIPLHEIDVTDIASLISSLSSASEEEKALVLEALAKAKIPRPSPDGGGGATAPTSGSTATDGAGEAKASGA